MEEQTKSQKRQVAYKVIIKDILNSNYVKERGWNPNYLVLNNQKISRINIIGTIIDKQNTQDINYSNITIDDGSGNINVRTFENKDLFNNLDIGNSVLIIGRPREFGNERYIVPEIIKKIQSKEWIELRKIELNKGKDNVQEKVEVYNVEEEIIEGDNDIISLIKQLDKGDGVNLNQIIEKSKNKDTEKIIGNMIKIGELFEIRPGKIKVLE